MKHITYTILSLLLILSACQPVRKGKGSEPSNKLNQLSWMLGKWQMETPDGFVTEEWEQPSDTQWQGVSYMITADGDTPFQEHIRLNYLNDTLYYMPTVMNQNEGKETSFTEKSISDSLIVFENLVHEFPQRIIYKRASDTTLVAVVEGIQNGQTRREEFTYVKKK